MKFQDFHGTTDTGRRSDAGDGIKQVLSSEASARDAKGIKDRASLDAAIEEIEEILRRNRTRIVQIEVRQTQIKRSIQGRRLPPDEYRAFCDEQNTLHEEYAQLRTENANLKVRQQLLLKDKRNLNVDDDGKRIDRLEVTNKLLGKILQEVQRIGKLLDGQGL